MKNLKKTKKVELVEPVGSPEPTPVDNFTVRWTEEERLCSAVVPAVSQEAAEERIAARIESRGIDGGILSEEDYQKELKKRQK